MTQHMPEHANIELNGLDTRLLFQIGKYELKEQIEIRQQLEQAANLPQLAPVLEQLQESLTKLIALEQHWDDVYTYGDVESFYPNHEALEQEMNAYRTMAFRDIDHYLTRLTARLEDAATAPLHYVPAVQDARALQQLLQMRME